MTDLIQRITEAIFRQEGEPAIALNPGNLRGAPWLSDPLIDSRGFWVPVNRQAGIAGAAHVVALRIAEGQSLRQLISAWAPPTDGNQTETYIDNISHWAAIPDAALPLWNFILEAVT